MSRRLVYFASFALVLWTTGSAHAILVGHWRLDGHAADSSISGLDGEITGSPNWVDGKVGLAMEIDGDDWIEIPGTSASDGYAGLSGEVTWAVWFKTSNAGTINSVMTLGPAGGAHVQGNRSINIEAAGDIMIRAHSVGALTSRRSTATVADGEWHHVAVTIAFETDGENDTMKVYIDGDLSQGYETTDVNVNQHSGPGADFIVTLGARGNTPFVGLIDDARVYDHVLTEEEILAAMAGGGGGFPLALLPNPEDGALLEATWVNLSWRAGSWAVSHDLYFGTSFDDVNDGAEGTFAGNLGTTSQVVGFPGFPAPDGLQPGSTYYWRVDEVNDANAASPWKGDVWSFSVPSITAYEPSPSDGAKFARTDTTLSWTPGFGAKLHSVYFGDNFDDVSNATGAEPQTETTFAPEALELDKTYYWRVDEFDGATTHTGAVWSFTTLPLIETTDDPNLVGWWKLDEGMGDTAVDYSGYGHHGMVYGDPIWVDGYDVGALQFDGADRIEMPGTSASDGYAALDGEVTWTAWFKTPATGGTRTILAQGPPGAAHVQGNRSVNVEASGVIMVRGNGVAGLLDFNSSGTVNDDQWHHLAVTIAFDASGVNDAMKVYIDGDLGSGYEVDTVDINQHSGVAGDFLFTVGDRAGSPFNGAIDDVRIYDKVLTQDEILMVMRIDPLLAWGAIPRSGSMPDIESATPLSWSPGDSASSHEVYFGTDADAVGSADTS
ncbi:MAG: LamG domain-containing protein, partial [Planctomycetota bacterium]